MILASSVPAWQIIAAAVLGAACLAVGVTDIVLFAAKKKTADESPAESETPAETALTEEPVPEAEEPAEEPVPEAEEPAEEPVPETEAPAEEPVPEAEAPAEEPVPEAEEPAEEPVPEAEAPAEEPVPEAEAPAEELVPEAEAPAADSASDQAELAVTAAAAAEEEDDEEPEEEEEDDEEPEEEEEDDEDDFAEEDDIEDIFVDDASDQKQDGGVILPVILPELGEARKIYVRYIFSFRAKLIQAPQEIQQRYGELADEVNSYYRVKMSVSWKQVRIYAGRNTLAMLLFKGRKLCMAFALDPKEYEETKYRGKDLSDIKRFQKTPMLLKLTSPRKVRYAKHLFADVAAKYGLEKGETVRTEFYLPYRTTDELVENKLVKRYVSGQEGEGGEIVRANIGEIIRNRVTLREAQAAISDEEAAELIEHEVAASLDYEDSEAPRGTKRGIINIDTLSKNFETDDTVTLEALIEKGLVPKKVGSVKVLARGILDKPLTVEAQDFSIDAVKMIVLTGGKAVKVK